ncbi:MAG: hypothetical protein VYB54_07090 [Pseudomonadota bacterium]|nr:hypothetical protein [Pseudomonadota bacterium]
MALLNDCEDLGGRRSLTDPARWGGTARPAPAPQREPQRPVAPEAPRGRAPGAQPAPAPRQDTGYPENDLTAGRSRETVAHVASGNIDTSLRDRFPQDRIQRLAMQRDELLRRHGLPAQEQVEPDMHRPASRPEPEDRYEPEHEAAAVEEAPMRNPRQSARPAGSFDQPRQQMPAPRRSSAPEPFATRVGEVRSHGGGELLDEIEKLRREVGELRRELKAIQQQGPSGVGPVERAVQRLAERMDRIDGGARPAISDGSGNGGRRRRGGGGGGGLFGLFSRRR